MEKIANFKIFFLFGLFGVCAFLVCFEFIIIIIIGLEVFFCCCKKQMNDIENLS